MNSPTTAPHFAIGDTCWFATVSSMLMAQLGVRHPDRGEIASYGARCVILDVAERYHAIVYGIRLPGGCELVAYENELCLLERAVAACENPHEESGESVERRGAEAVAA